MAHTIVHFQMPSDNIERAKKFYNNMFGWKGRKNTESHGVLYFHHYKKLFSVIGPVEVL
jgi:predicted enzyme related to lactoylglutathione lyase